MSEPFLAALRAELPDLTLITDADGIEPYRHDRTEYAHPGMPAAVAVPRTTADVATIVRLAATHRVPVVARGAGSGVSGGALGVDGAITISMAEMTEIIEIDEANLTVRCRPGIMNAELGRAVAAHGLFYPPDPASYEYCSIGGNIAENSGGLRCLKYGVTRDYVLGLEVVLADGSVIRTGGKTVKDVMGYDLTGLIVGSEGTLGIVTEATLRLVPMPPPKLTILAFFPGIREAGHAVAAITRAGIIPVTLELMDRHTMTAVERALHLGLDPDAGAMLLIESDAGGAAAERELDACEQACTGAGASMVVRAADAREADWLREARRKAHWALEQEGVARMEDVGVPRDRVADLLEAIERVSAERGVVVGVFGHAGDGNFHPCFVMERDDPDAETKLEAVRTAMFEAVLALGGTISGEHGTGTVKRGWVEAQRGPDAVRAMRAIKAALDPLGILNPGKLVP